ncbi:hypothetical protein [Streptomyces sp. AA1529]|uniref:hypothetical protein n=1 Tax=Streptomyces sp. AA1529 TaxID=1203257 RepID=UPI00031791BB
MPDPRTGSGLLHAPRLRGDLPAAAPQPVRGRPARRHPAALLRATLLADAKKDLPGAARIIDRALGIPDERPAPGELLRLLVLRADLAQRSGDTETSRRAQAEAEAAAVLNEWL